MFSLRTTLKIHELNVTVQESNFKSYKSFNKVLFLAQKVETFHENVVRFIECHTNLTNTQVSSLNIIELLILLLEIRTLSLGNAINIMVDTTKDPEYTTQEDKEVEKKYTAYNKSSFLIQQDLLNILSQEYLTIDDFNIKLKSPTLQECYGNHLHTHHFIDWVEYKNVKNTFHGQDKKDAFENLPFLIHDTLLVKINEYIKLFEDIILVNIENVDEETKNVKINFTYNYEFLIHLIKLLYSNNLITLHENLFRMSQFAHIDLNYLDNCTPGEVFLYMKLLEADIHEKNTRNN
jgi:hypothetical protein